MSEPTREIFFNLPSIWNKVFMYVLFFITLLCLFGLIARRVRLWGLKFEVYSSVDFFKNLLFQSDLLRKKTTGWSHFFIYFGFLVLVVTTTSVFLDYDLGIKIYRGNYYLIITFLSDLAGLLIITLCSSFLYRRYVSRDESLVSSKMDLIFTVGLILLCLQGFILEGLRITMTSDPWQSYSFVGMLFSNFFSDFSAVSLSNFHFINWWFHTVTVFAFFLLLPYTKAWHLLTAPLNLLLKRDTSFSKYPGVLSKFESGELDSVGYKKITDLDYKNRLDLDACTSCGRCQEVCPAFASGKPLSPKWLILHQRKVFYSIAKQSSSGIFERIDNRMLEAFSPNYEFISTNDKLNAALKFQGPELMGDVFDPDLYWSCTTCRACVDSCPVGINHLEHILEARRNSVMMEGRAPSEALSTLKTLQLRQVAQNLRSSKSMFFESLGVKILSPGDSVDYLLWVGCISVGDKRKEEILRSLVLIMQAANLDFGVLGDTEICTGDPAKRIGDEITAQTLGAQVREILRSVQFKKLITHCPHCANILLREYPVDDPSFKIEVMHHTQLINDLLQTGKIKVKGNNSTFVIHDPCYLSRFLGITEDQRSALLQIGKVTDPEQSKERTFCCGAGGGQYFYDLKLGKRVNYVRAQQLTQVKADLIVTMCPFCNQMINDGVDMLDERRPVKDIAEVVSENL